MNPVMKTLLKLKRFLLISTLSLSVLSCGGETALLSAGISGTGIVFGAITGFGSVFVNGVKYEVDNAQFDVDGIANSSQSNLKIGMVVKMEFTSFDDGTFEADSLVYDDEVEGPITSAVTPNPTSTKKEFSVLQNIVVVVDSTTTSFHKSSSVVGVFDFDSIATNDVVEVSGFVDANGKIQATLIEKKGELGVGGSTTTTVEMHGTVENHTLNVQFTLNGITVFYDATTPLDDLPTGPVNGALVEVKGTYDSVAGTIQAIEIEGEGEDGISSDDPDVSVSVQGSVAGFTSASSEFTVSGVRVLVVPGSVLQSLLDQLDNGVQVEVEGTLSNGVLQAVKVEIREGKSSYVARVKSVDTSTNSLTIEYPSVGELVLTADSQSILEDDDHNQISLSSLSPGTDVKVSARELTPGQRLIVLLRKELAGNDSYKIGGLVEAIDTTSITIDGLTFQLDGSTVYDPLTLNGAIVAGVDLIEVEDEGPGYDGIANEISIHTP